MAVHFLIKFQVRKNQSPGDTHVFSERKRVAGLTYSHNHQSMHLERVLNWAGKTVFSSNPITPLFKSHSLLRMNQKPPPTTLLQTKCIFLFV